MVVAFDTWALAERFNHHGINVYCRHLLTQFQRLAPQVGITIRPFQSVNGKNYANSLKASDHFEPTTTRLLSYSRLWRLGGSSIAGRLAGADLICCPNNVTVPLGIVPVVSTIHDVTALRMPTNTPWVNWGARFQTRAAAKRSARVITDSQWSRQDVVELYGVAPEKVVVAYPGYDNSRFNTDKPDPETLASLLRRLGVRKRYMLHHGVLQPRKNLVRLIDAYRLVVERNRNLDVALVLAGPLGWNYEEIVKTAQRQGKEGEVILTGGLPDDEMALLVKGASLCVVPSLYEGFCLPMVESMASGIPTIVSKASCLPEVSRGVLRYFDPLLVDEMATEIEHALEDTVLHAQLAQAGPDVARHYDWETCARQILSVFHEVVPTPKG